MRCPRSPIPALFLILLALLPLNGCGVAVGVGATAGVAAMEERGLGGAIEDSSIKAAIWKAWLNYDANLFLSADIAVHEGRVLLTGSVQDPDATIQAVQLAWQVSGVRQVINEIEAREKGGISDYARDTWITGQLRTKLTFDDKIWAINYTAETVNQVIHLMGIAQSEEELDRVIRHARSIEYVRRVVSHVRIKGTEMPGS